MSSDVTIQQFIKKSHWLLGNKFVPDNLSTFHLHLLIKPLPVAAALDPTLARPTLWAGVEAAHTVHIQAVAHVSAVGQQPAFVVVHSALGGAALPVRKIQST